MLCNKEASAALAATFESLRSVFCRWKSKAPRLDINRNAARNANKASCISYLSDLNCDDFSNDERADNFHACGCIEHFQAQRAFPQDTHAVRVQEVHANPEQNGKK